MDGYLNQDAASFHPGEVHVNLQFTFGTSGAVPSRTATGSRFAGIASVVKSGTSDYLITFNDCYVTLLDKHIEIDQATQDPTKASLCTVVPTDIVPAASGGGTIKFTTRKSDGSGAAIAGTSGDVLRARFVFAREKGNG